MQVYCKYIWFAVTALSCHGALRRLFQTQNQPLPLQVPTRIPRGWREATNSKSILLSQGHMSHSRDSNPHSDDLTNRGGFHKELRLVLS